MNQPKNPGLAAVLSFFIPGLGQIYNGNGGRAVGFILGWLVSIVLTFVLIGFVTGFMVWLWSMLDAYASAQRHNRLLSEGVIT